MRTTVPRINILSCLVFCGFLGGEINGQESSPHQVAKIGVADVGERLSVMNKALETIMQGEVRPRVIPEAYEAGVKPANLTLKLSPGQREYSSDLTGIWKMAGWIQLISRQHDCLRLYLEKRGTVKLDDEGQVHFTSIWPNGPERTEIFGKLSGGRLISKEMYGDKMQTMIRKMPRSSSKYALDQGSQKEIWTETLDHELRAFYHGSDWDTKTTVLTGFWQVKGAEAYLLVTPDGDALYFQMSDFGHWTVDDHGQILVQYPNKIRPEPYARFYGNCVINDQGDYQNIYQKFEP